MRNQRKTMFPAGLLLFMLLAWTGAAQADRAGVPGGATQQAQPRGFMHSQDPHSRRRGTRHERGHRDFEHRGFEQHRFGTRGFDGHHDFGGSFHHDFSRGSFSGHGSRHRSGHHD